MRILRDYIIEDTLCEKSTTIIQRARHLTAQNTVILKSIKTADAPAADIAALEHDYWAIRKVSSDFVIKAESLQNATDGRLVMILEDIGGIDLKSFLNATGRIPLERFLDLALAAACGIRDIHSANLIHKDINPANIIFNLHTNSLKIIDFHIATQMC